MRLIDADELNLLLGISDRDIYAKYMLDKMPTIDAVPVVRCENCKHGYPCGDDVGCLHPELVMEMDGCTPIRKKDFYCAYGELKEGAK